VPVKHFEVYNTYKVLTFLRKTGKPLFRLCALNPMLKQNNILYLTLYKFEVINVVF